MLQGIQPVLIIDALFGKVETYNGIFANRIIVFLEVIKRSIRILARHRQYNCIVIRLHASGGYQFLHKFPGSVPTSNNKKFPRRRACFLCANGELENQKAAENSYKKFLH